MASNARLSHQEPLSGGTPGTTAPSGQPGERLKPFSITHVRRSQPGRVTIDVIAAADEGDAAIRAGRHFPDSTILRVCRAPSNSPLPDATQMNGESAPNARFIRGEFREAETEDEPTLRDLCK